MKFRKLLIQSVLFFFVVNILGYGGCYLGSSVGYSIDVKNGTFGKGLEGSPYESGLMLLGWIVGLTAGIAVCVGIYHALKRRSG